MIVIKFTNVALVLMKVLNSIVLKAINISPILAVVKLTKAETNRIKKEIPAITKPTPGDVWHDINAKLNAYNSGIKRFGLL